MRVREIRWRSGRRATQALTLMELLIATALASIILGGLTMVTLYGQTSFAVMAATVDLDSKSRQAADLLSRELRLSTGVLAAHTNGPVKSLTLWGADGVTNRLYWDEDDRKLTLEQNGMGRTLLTDCERWEFALLNRAVTVTQTNFAFNSAATLSDCKIVDLSWKCSRVVIRQIRTETVETLRIGLRNKTD